MNPMYAVFWYYKNNPDRCGNSLASHDKENLLAWAEAMNAKYPAIHHEVRELPKS